MTSKGQIVIPAAVRRRYGIGVGTRFVVEDDAGRIVLTPVTRDRVAQIRGKYAGVEALDELQRSRARDRQREDAEGDARWRQR